MLKNKEHILKIIDILYHECKSSGGDGSIIWYVELGSLDSIVPLLAEYNSKLESPFVINITDNNKIDWYRDQECVKITTDATIYSECSSWDFVLKSSLF